MRRRAHAASSSLSTAIRSATWCRISGYSTETHFALKGQLAHCHAPRCVLPFSLFCQAMYFVLPMIPASPRVWIFSAEDFHSYSAGGQKLDGSACTFLKTRSQ